MSDLTSQTVTVLASLNAILRSCASPITTPGPTEAVLLLLLQAAYPSSNWDLATLTTVLNNGALRGVFTLVGTSWYDVYDMVDLAALNYIYAAVAPTKLKQPRCRLTAVANSNGLFQGSVPCFACLTDGRG